MPRIYLVERPEPNAFATGRNPQHAAIAVTTGLLELMDERQVIGVLAHELSHVKNRDTLIGTIAATIGGAISFLAQMGQFQLLFGGGDDDNGNPALALVAIILAPIAALVIQLAVSRSREYQADATGASLTGDPDGLAQALATLAANQERGGLLGQARAPDAAGAAAPGQPGLLAPLDREPARGVADGLAVLDPPAARGPHRPPPRDAPPVGNPPPARRSPPAAGGHTSARDSPESNDPRLGPGVVVVSRRLKEEAAPRAGDLVAVA